MKAMNRIACLIVLMLASMVPAYGQSSQDSSQEEPVVVNTSLVTVNVIVTDNKGRYVKELNLTSSQFMTKTQNRSSRTSQSGRLLFRSELFARFMAQLRPMCPRCWQH